MNKIAVRPFATLKLSFFALAGVALLVSAGKPQPHHPNNQRTQLVLVHAGDTSCVVN